MSAGKHNDRAPKSGVLKMLCKFINISTNPTRILKMIQEFFNNVYGFQVYRVTKQILRENMVQAGGG